MKSKWSEMVVQSFNMRKGREVNYSTFEKELLAVVLAIGYIV